LTASAAVAVFCPFVLLSAGPPRVNPHFVQGHGELIASTGSFTVTHAYQQGNQAGSLLVLVAGSNAATAPSIESVTDSQGNSWQSTGAKQSGVTGDAEVWYAKNAKPGANTVSIRWSTAKQSESDWIGEYAGFDPRGPLDAHLADVQNSSPYRLAGSDKAGAGDLVLAAYADDGNADAIRIADGKTERYNNSSTGNTHEQLVVGDLLHAAAGPQSASWTASGSGAADLLMACFKQAAAVTVR
jgi:hypothetical protein